jgi:excisionase family DNA binding protein
MASGGSNRLIGCKELAEFLSVPERTVRENWRRWGITGYKIGRAIRFRGRDVETFLQKNIVI